MLVSGGSRSAALVLPSTFRIPIQDARFSQEAKTDSNLPSLSNSQAYGSKLADALWSMESNGIALEQKPTRTALNKEEKPDAADEFLKVSNMTPAERIRYFFLKDRELNEDLLAVMSERDREAIEEQIKELIFQQLGLENEDGKPGDAPSPEPEGPPVPIDGV